MLTMIKWLFSNETGATMVEYSLLLALIGVTIVATLMAVGVVGQPHQVIAQARP